MANAADVGGYLLDGLRALQDKHALIGDVRGKGLMIGIELVKDRATKARATAERDRVVDAAFARGPADPRCRTQHASASRRHWC